MKTTVNSRKNEMNFTTSLFAKKSFAQGSVSGEKFLTVPYALIVLLIFVFLSLSGPNLFAQGVGISETTITPDANAILELKSTLRGFLAPRMTTAQRTTLGLIPPSEGMLVFDTDTQSFWYFSSGWKAISAGMINGANGGTGVDNSGKTITLGGNLTTIGAFPTTLTSTGSTSITLPTSGTLATLAGTEALTGKTINGITLNAAATGFSLSGGTISKTLTVPLDATVSGTNTGDQTLSGLGGVVANAAIVAGTNTKVTYDAKGLVTAGSAATTADIAASTDRNYVTDAQAVVIGNTSGTNTGDQTLSGLGGVPNTRMVNGYA
ncbi:MAG: hypothetical protein WCP08_16430, partial [Prolixibacteraceae bacterium]